MKNPELSIAIPTLGRESIFMTLDSILKNKGNFAIEILVIGNFPGENDVKINKYTEKYKFIRVIRKNFAHGDLSRKRNLALKEAKARIIAFCDDDIKITPKWIKEGLDTFKKYENVGIVSGPSISPKEDKLVPRILGETYSSIAAGKSLFRYNKGKGAIIDKKGNQIIGCNFFVLKKAFIDAGEFNPYYIPGEEIEFAGKVIKRGYSIVINPEMWLLHFARPTIKKFFVQNFRFGYSRIRMMKKGIQKDFFYIMPVIWLMIFILLLIDAIFLPGMWKFFALYTELYLLFNMLSTIISVTRSRNIENILIFFTIPIMHFSYSIGELKEIFFPGKDFKSS